MPTFRVLWLLMYPVHATRRNQVGLSWLCWKAVRHRTGFGEGTGEGSGHVICTERPEPGPSQHAAFSRSNSDK